MKKCQFSTSKTKNHPAKKQASFLVGVFFILLTGCGLGGAPTAPTPEVGAGANSVVVSTFTAVPTNPPVALETSMPTLVPTPNAKVTGQLPGLSPRNVTVSLEEQKFTCTQVKKGVVYYERTCTRGVPSVQVFHVVISGREPFLVDFIEASVLQYEKPDIEIANSILGFIATMPYEGATPEDARAWVESTIPDLSSEPGGAQEMVFGGVKYVLYGKPTALTLEMGELP
jgi:hypothetical protein